jgi:hypothetical protein
MLAPDDQRQMAQRGPGRTATASRYRPYDSGSFCLVGGVGSCTGSGLSLARIALSLLIAQAGQKGDPSLASAGNMTNVG